LIFLPADEQTTSFFVADSFNLNKIFIFINVVKNTKSRYPQLEFRDAVGAQSLSIAGFVRRLVRKLLIDLVDPSTRPQPWPGVLAQDSASGEYWKVPRACPWGSTISCCSYFLNGFKSAIASRVYSMSYMLA
jgi:hypothetical protein